MKKPLLALTLLLLACPPAQVIPPVDPSKLPRPQGAKKDWTILVYMAADQDDLKPFAYMNLYEMETPVTPGEPGAAAKSDVVVQLDTPGTTGLRRLHERLTPREVQDLQQALETRTVQVGDQADEFLGPGPRRGTVHRGGAQQRLDPLAGRPEIDGVPVLTHR